MKTKSIILLFLAMSFSIVADASSLMIPAVSSVRLPLNPKAALELTAPTVEATQKLNSINVTGNLIVSGNSVVAFSGLSLSQPLYVFINGNVTLVGNGTLVLKYATLYLVGAKGPYNRCIRLSGSSADHPRLSVLNASVVAYTGSYGAAIYAYNNSEIVGREFTFYRQKIPQRNPSVGGLTKIECYDKSSLNVTRCQVDLLMAYGNSRISINTGGGPRKAGGSYPSDSNIGFDCHDSSTVNLYAVAFSSALVSDKAHLILTYCKEQRGTTITATGQSRVDSFASTMLSSPLNASGNSYIYLSSTMIRSSEYEPSVYVYDDATFGVTQDCNVGGVITTFDHSRVFLNSTNGASGLANIAIESHDFSSVFAFNSSFYSGPFSVQITLFDGSRFSLTQSFINDGWISVSDNASFSLSHSALSNSRLVCQDNANVTIAEGSNVRNSVEMRGNTTVSIDSSIAASIYCADSSNASFVNASVTELRASDGAKVYVRDSTIDEFSFSGSNVTGSFAKLTGLLKNFTLGGSRSQVSLLNTTVSNLDFLFSGYSNVTVTNSTIRNLTLDGSSIATLNNTTVSGSRSVLGNSSVLEYSALRVRSVDYFGNPLNGSVVTVGTGYAGRNVLQQQTSDRDGWANFFLFLRLDNATGSFSIEVVTVKGWFGSVSASQDVNLALINKDVTLSFPLPAWSMYLLPLVVLIAVVALLAFGYYALRRIRRRKE